MTRALSNFRILRDIVQGENIYPPSIEMLSLVDPFADGAPYRMACVEGEVRVYSIGPDRRDDGGRIVYDPTNGARSRGDVVGVLRSWE